MNNLQNHHFQLNENIFREQHKKLSTRTDFIFAKLFVFQWVLGIVLAISLSPRSWNGAQSSIHLHVYLALFLGAALAAFPIWVIKQEPGRAENRLIVAAAQMGFSTLFIHLTSGRIETHFHIFGSLAFLAFYRDFRPIALATFITALDHFVRGAFWPESVYGVQSASILRALEHIGWVLFEDAVLFFSIKISIDEMKALSKYTEDTVYKTSKLSEIGKLASNIVHEINNPVSIIQGKAKVLLNQTHNGSVSSETITSDLEKIISMTERLTKIVSNIKSATHNSELEEMKPTSLKAIIDGTIELFKNKIQNKNIEFRIDEVPDIAINCRSFQIEQVLINLLCNSTDAIEKNSLKWIRITFEVNNSDVLIHVTDSGDGISHEHLEYIMTPFYTTKPPGQGTGLGLSISKEIMDQHGGTINYDTDYKNTRFTICLPILNIMNKSAQNEKLNHF